MTAVCIVTLAPYNQDLCRGIAAAVPLRYAAAGELNSYRTLYQQIIAKIDIRCEWCVLLPKSD